MPPVVPVTAEEPDYVRNSGNAGANIARATPAHAVLTAHALVYGLISSTGKLFQNNAPGSWAQDFMMDSTEAARTVTPVGCCLLKLAFSGQARTDSAASDLQ